MRKLFKTYLALIIVITLVFAETNNAKAQGIVFIRDAEIEHALRTYALPLLKAASLPPENVDIYIIQDNSLNAFVTGGMNIFIHTGLITESEDPLMLIGVMAHEIGHIAGGHLVRKNETYEKAILGTALSYVLGAGAAVAGSGEAAAAIISGGQHLANREILRHSRIHEQSADQAALNILDATGFSATGLLNLLNKLNKRETILRDFIDPYALTHPLSQQRISHIENHIISVKKSEEVSSKLRNMQRRIVAKINAYLKDPEKTLKAFPKEDKSDVAKYARSIAYNKKSDLRSALLEINSLISQNPEDPYYNELKGQILFEHGKVRESLPFYQKAVDLIPESALLKFVLANAQLATEDPRLLEASIASFEQVLAKDPQNAQAWRQIATAYGRNKQLGLSYLALAEESSVLGNKDEAIKFAKLAEINLKDDNDPALLRINDIRAYLNNKYDDKSFF